MKKHLSTRIIQTLKSSFLILIALVLVKPTFAAIPDENILDFYNRNGIYYYNPVGNENECNTSSTTLVGNDLTEKMWNFFIQNGFNDAQTAGILGNGMAESGNQPTRASRSSYFGLFQWGGGRKDAKSNDCTRRFAEGTDPKLLRDSKGKIQEAWVIKVTRNRFQAC